MADDSKIGWTDATWNTATGCTKVGPGCDICYMDRWAGRAGRNPGELLRTSSSTFNRPLRWHREHVPGERPRLVFANSLSDFFHRGQDPWRAEAWDIIRRCPDLIFQLLTKRHGRIAANLPPDWGPDGWEHVWVGTSVENSDWLRRGRVLTQVPARVRFLSIEPLLQALDIAELRAILRDGIHWVIVGGESGAEKKVRPFHEQWCLDIIEACDAEGVPCFVKQVGRVTIPLEGGIRLVPAGDLTDVRPELLVRQWPAAHRWPGGAIRRSVG